MRVDTAPSPLARHGTGLAGAVALVRADAGARSQLLTLLNGSDLQATFVVATQNIAGVRRWHNFPSY